MKKIIILYLTALMLFSCKTTEKAPNEPDIIEPVQEPVEIIKEETIIIEPIVEPETTIHEGIEVSEDLYKKTFDEINDLIKEVTQLIRRKNFNGWKKFLSKSYVEMAGSADYLKEISQLPSLKDVVELKNLRDYFLWVVVPSRVNAILDEIVFKDEQHVTAYMYIYEVKTILKFQFPLKKTQKFHKKKTYLVDVGCWTIVKA